MRSAIAALVCAWACAAGDPRASAAPGSGSAGAHALLLPGGPLRADGESAHLLRLYVIEGEALERTPPQVTAQRGAIVEPPRAAPDGGYDLRYRPPRVHAPESDTLTVTARGVRLSLPVALEPAGRTQISLSVTPDPLLLGRGQAA